jgi:hypothetical protein
MPIAIISHTARAGRRRHTRLCQDQRLPSYGSLSAHRHSPPERLAYTRTYYERPMTPGEEVRTACECREDEIKGLTAE